MRSIKSRAPSTDEHGLLRLNCAANAQPNGRSKSCYSDEQLLYLRDLWNQYVQKMTKADRKRHPNARAVEDTDPERIRLDLMQNLFDVCRSEGCWLRHDFAKKSKIEFTDVFAPLAPASWDKNPIEWLTDRDIAQVLQQYEKKYPHFKMIGPMPINFAKRRTGECINRDMCNLTKLVNGMIDEGMMYGVIMNTDVDTGHGEHWKCMYLRSEGDAVEVEKYDSGNGDEEKEVKDWLLELRREVEKRGKVMNVRDMKQARQQGTTECGMYVIMNIIGRLEGRETKNRDAEVNELRLLHFNEGWRMGMTK